MPIEVPCPGCGSKLRAPDEKAGKKAKCKKCNTSFRLPGVPVDSVGESQMLSAITIPTPPGEDDVPLAAAVEELDGLASLPSADPFDFVAPVADKPAASPVPPVPAATAAPSARPAFGAAKAAAASPPAPSAKAPAPAPKPAAKVPPKAPPAPPPAKAPPPAPEILSLDDDAHPPPAKKAAPVAKPTPATAAPSDDPFDFAAAPEPRAEAKPKKKLSRDEDEEDDRAKSKKRSRDEDAEEKPAPAKKPAPAPAPDFLDADPVDTEPASATGNTVDDPFGFNFSGAETVEEPKSNKKRARDDEDDDRPRRKGKEKDQEDAADPDDGPRYLRPDQRGSGKSPLLLAGILGAVAILAVVAAVLVLNAKKREAEEAKRKAEEEAAAKAAMKEEVVAPPVVPPVEPPKKDPPKKDPPKKDPVEPPKKDPVEPPKKDPPKKDPVPPAPPLGAALELPKTVKSLAFQPPRAKLELVEKPSTVRPATAVEVPLAKARHVFVPKKRDQDAVVVWVSTPGVGGKGERIGVDVYSAPTGVKVHRFEYDGDGRGGVCDVSEDGKFFVASGADQKLTVWNLAEKSKVLEGFDPYADKAGEKAAGLAAVFFTKDSGRVLTVSTAGSVHVFEVAGKKMIGSFQPTPTLVPNRVALGTSVAIDEEHTAIALAVGDTVFQIRANATLDVTWKLQLGEVARPLGLATHGVPGFLVYSFETAKKEKAVLLVKHEGDSRTVYQWPDAAGEPRAAYWAGGQFAVIATERGAVYVELTYGKKLAPLALAEVAGGKGPHAAIENGHWYLAAHPTDPNKSVLLELTTDAISDFRNSIDGKELPTVKLDDKGLSR